MEGIHFDRINDEQRLEGDAIVEYVTATVRIDGKGPFFYRVKKTPNWRLDLQTWAQQQAADVRALLS